MHSPKFFQELIEEELKKIQYSDRPVELYDPIRYMMNLGGKRVRPVLLLMAHEMFGGNPFSVTSPALGIEMFHNFTLLHDDIMDKAPLRRSQPTVHVRWNPDIAILSGDTMFVQSCQLMMQVEEKHIKKVLERFHQTAIEVCEGQQLDMNFELRDNVSIGEYIGMITLKTAVLLGCSLEIGTLLAGIGKEEAALMSAFGKNLGVAFQIHDDILDVYGDASKFGKQVGGDILSNKKTFLLLTALAQATGELKDELNHWLHLKEYDPSEKVNAVKSIYSRLDIRAQSEAYMDKIFKSSLEAFDQIHLPATQKEPLRQLAEKLMVRES